ncbi:uncharacterized protein LOC117815583 [Notolabrus celidotus]|uniref:uncharacterized protein LOC117815583 n=1 Tax=Notolabrus celidotus TaxID=1203425 RepID=UPI00148F9B7B|nr:uncharacterized protein LOC117815583 [Notolabrus celidotus]
MNNRSIAWWLRQIGLPQYTKTLEREYYGLEGLLYVTDAELKEAGIEDATHRESILGQLSRHRQRLDPHSASYIADGQESGMQVKRRVSRKYSLGSSMDLVKPKKDLFRQSVLPRLQRADKKHRLSASCSQLRPLNEDNTISEAGSYQDSKHRNAGADSGVSAAPGPGAGMRRKEEKEEGSGRTCGNSSESAQRGGQGGEGGGGLGGTAVETD